MLTKAGMLLGSTNLPVNITNSGLFGYLGLSLTLSNSKPSYSFSESSIQRVTLLCPLSIAAWMALVTSKSTYEPLFAIVMVSSRLSFRGRVLHCTEL